MNSASIILKYLSSYVIFGYPLIFLGMMFEGDMFLFTTAFLTQQGVFNFSYVTAAVFFGVLAGDLLWYWFGHEVNKLHISISLIKRWMEKLAEPLDEHLKVRLGRTVFISKFAYGFNHLTLMRAGMKGIHLGAFIKANIAATLVWMLIVGGLGYISGASFELIKRYLRFAEVALLIGLIIFFIFWHFVVTKRLKKEL